MRQFISAIWKDHIKASQYLAGVRFGVSMLVSILLVRSFLTKSEVGSIEYIYFLGVNFSFFLTNGLSNAALGIIPKYKSSEQNLFSTFLWLSVCLGGALALGILVFGKPFLEYIQVPQYQMYIPLVALLAALMTMGGWAEVVYIMRKEARKLCIFASVIHGLRLCMIGALLYYKGSLLQILYVYVLWEAIKCFWGIIAVQPTLTWTGLKSYRFIIWVSFPLFLHFLLGKGIDFVNGNIVMRFLDETQFLYFQYGAREIPLSNLFIGALGTAMIPMLSKHMDVHLPELRARLKKMLLWIVPVSIVLMFISPILFQRVYGEAFIQSAAVFNVLMLILIGRFMLPHIIIYAKGDNYLFVYVTGFEVVINLVLTISFVQMWGIWGVALASVISNVLHALIGVLICSLKYRISLASYLPIPTYLYSMALLIGAYVVVQCYVI